MLIFYDKSVIAPHFDTKPCELYLYCQMLQSIKILWLDVNF